MRYFLLGSEDRVNEVLKAYFDANNGNLPTPFPKPQRHDENQCVVDLDGGWEKLLAFAGTGSDKELKWYSWASEWNSGWALSARDGAAHGYVLWEHGNPATPTWTQSDRSAQDEIWERAHHLHPHEARLQGKHLKIDVAPTGLPAAHFHNRIWRGIGSPKPGEVGLHDSWTHARRVRKTLEARLCAVFEHIEPTTQQLGTHGHSIRDLIILASTEVENAWKSVLLAHVTSQPAGYLNRNHYVKVSAPLRLPEYKLQLTMYPQVGVVVPFDGWVHGSSQKPDFYEAYNAVKHDRELSLHQAELRHAINAVAAVYVMQVAQFGPDDDSEFSIAEGPWFGAAERYLPPYLMLRHPIRVPIAKQWTPVSLKIIL